MVTVPRSWSGEPADAYVAPIDEVFGVGAVGGADAEEVGRGGHSSPLPGSNSAGKGGHERNGAARLVRLLHDLQAVGPAVGEEDADRESEGLRFGHVVFSR